MGADKVRTLHGSWLMLLGVSQQRCHASVPCRVHLLDGLSCLLPRARGHSEARAGFGGRRPGGAVAFSPSRVCAPTRKQLRRSHHRRHFLPGGGAAKALILRFLLNAGDAFRVTSRQKTRPSGVAGSRLGFLSLSLPGVLVLR